MRSRAYLTVPIFPCYSFLILYRKAKQKKGDLKNNKKKLFMRVRECSTMIPNQHDVGSSFFDLSKKLAGSMVRGDSSQAWRAGSASKR